MAIRLISSKQAKPWGKSKAGIYVGLNVAACTKIACMSVKAMQRCHRFCGLKKWISFWYDGLGASHIWCLQHWGSRLQKPQPFVLLQLSKLLHNVAGWKRLILGQEYCRTCACLPKKTPKWIATGISLLSSIKIVISPKNAQYSHLKS